MEKFSVVLFGIMIIFNYSLNAQWSSEWSSPEIESTSAAGWLSFEKNGDEWNFRYFIVDATEFQIMNSTYSATAEYTYTFTSAEQLAGNQIYSVVEDLTGDNITEFYVLSYYGDDDPYRQSFKIIDITNGNVLFEKEDNSYYYTYPVIWDPDNDGVLECTFSRYDYPDFSDYIYQVYNTGVTTNAPTNNPAIISFKLDQNYPNPFNPETTISYSIQKSSNIKLEIYDINGRLVKTIVNDFLNAGNYNTVWDGSNALGNKVASGAYFYQLKSNGFVTVKKMILLK